MAILSRNRLIFCLIFLASFLGEGLAASSPTEAVKATVEEVIRLLSDPGLKDPAQKPRLRQQIKRAVDRRFDYEEMAKRTLPNWNQLNPGQRREFVQLFAELLEASYADKLERYSGEKVAYQGERVEGDRAEVCTVLLRKNDRIPINYRLLHKTEWLVYDVIIEGVSLVNNYRSQFSRVLGEASYQELVRRLRSKVEETRQLRGS